LGVSRFMEKEKVNKSLVVNLSCLLVIVLGHTITPEVIKAQVLGMGYFGFSGAITNWLAIHMLFEKVPGLYGSGIIPLKFEAFKGAIRDMIMNQFFTVDNIRRFTTDQAPDLAPMLEHIDYNTVFEGFVEVVMQSKLGGMLGMFGGASALDGMREPFAKTLRTKLVEITQQPDFLENLMKKSAEKHHLQEKIGSMVDNRLNEMTPQMVKDIIQEMIRSHLGWLVIWGGVFGSLIGLLSSFVN